MTTHAPAAPHQRPSTPSSAPTSNRKLPDAHASRHSRPRHGGDLPKAVDAALAKVSGTATSADLEHNHGTPAWHIDVTDSKGKNHEVTVDATTGKVTATKTDQNNDHDSNH
ncbi:PepSY domain-containing protein [Streptomyces sp. NPDC048106]|uniref:PepSY domain-containing protein n=1 Tax=Streptomyces sp. NPDC048106 TaxID=3155750 RepID=UPI0034517EA9